MSVCVCVCVCMCVYVCVCLGDRFMCVCVCVFCKELLTAQTLGTSMAKILATLNSTPRPDTCAHTHTRTHTHTHTHTHASTDTQSHICPPLVLSQYCLSIALFVSLFRSYWSSPSDCTYTHTHTHSLSHTVTTVSLHDSLIDEMHTQEAERLVLETSIVLILPYLS